MAKEKNPGAKGFCYTWKCERSPLSARSLGAGRRAPLCFSITTRARLEGDPHPPERDLGGLRFCRLPASWCSWGLRVTKMRS